jgi:glycosyltransferase involved in cell wall biosynthesis
MIFNHGGPLMREFSQLGPVRRLSHPWTESSCLAARILRRLTRQMPFKPKRFARWVEEWRSQGRGLIYSNTGTNGRLLKALPVGSGRIVSHIHELAYGLHRFNRPGELAATLTRTDLFLAVSSATAGDLRALGVPAHRIQRIPNFLGSIPAAPDTAGARAEICRRLKLSPGAKLIVGCGHIDWVKGTDIFVDAANVMHQRENSPVFVWLGGNTHRRFARRARARCAKPQLVHFVGDVSDPASYFAASDAVLVTSRAESFSRVALEAGALGRPVLAFASARGPADLLAPDCLVPETSGAAMAAALRELLTNPDEAQRQGVRLRERITVEFLSARWVPEILAIMEAPPND